MTQQAIEMESAIHEMAVSFFDIPSRIGNPTSVMPAEAEDNLAEQIYDYCFYRHVTRMDTLVFEYEKEQGDTHYLWSLEVSNIVVDWQEPLANDWRFDEEYIHDIYVGRSSCTLYVWNDEDGTDEHYVVPFDQYDLMGRLKNYCY